MEEPDATERTADLTEGSHEGDGEWGITSSVQVSATTTVESVVSTNKLKKKHKKERKTKAVAEYPDNSNPKKNVEKKKNKRKIDDDDKAEARSAAIVAGPLEDVSVSVALVTKTNNRGANTKQKRKKKKRDSTEKKKPPTMEDGKYERQETVEESVATIELTSCKTASKKKKKTHRQKSEKTNAAGESAPTNPTEEAAKAEVPREGPRPMPRPFLVQGQGTEVAFQQQRRTQTGSCIEQTKLQEKCADGESPSSAISSRLEEPPTSHDVTKHAQKGKAIIPEPTSEGAQPNTKIPRRYDTSRDPESGAILNDNEDPTEAPSNVVGSFIPLKEGRSVHDKKGTSFRSKGCLLLVIVGASLLILSLILGIVFGTGGGASSVPIPSAVAPTTAPAPAVVASTTSPAPAVVASTPAPAPAAVASTPAPSPVPTEAITTRQPTSSPAPTRSPVSVNASRPPRTLLTPTSTSVPTIATERRRR
jgi:hypothetical protein